METGKVNRYRSHPYQSNNNSNEIINDRSYLTTSMQEIPLFRAKYISRITEEQRMELALNELSLVGEQVETKAIETQCKSRTYGIINTLTSLVILLGTSITGVLEAVSASPNIVIIVISAIVFFAEGTHKLFKWGPQGVLYKSGNIQLRRISRQIRDCMYYFHRYSVDQLLTIISQLRSQYDDIDENLYKMSMGGGFNQGNNNGGLVNNNGSGFDIEQGSNPVNINPANINLPILPVATNAQTPVLNQDTEDKSPHVHIHISGMTPTPTTPPYGDHLVPEDNLRGSKPRKIIPTINIESEDQNTPPVSLALKSIKSGSSEDN